MFCKIETHFDVKRVNVKVCVLWRIMGALKEILQYPQLICNDIDIVQNYLRLSWLYKIPVT